MSFIIKATDIVVCFWYAESPAGDNFLMILRKRPLHWRIDWRFFYRRGGERLNWSGQDKNHAAFALSGLQVPRKQVVHEAQAIFDITSEEYTVKRICQCIDGTGQDLFKAFQKYSLTQMKEVEK